MFEKKNVLRECKCSSKKRCLAMASQCSHRFLEGVTKF